MLAYLVFKATSSRWPLSMPIGLGPIHNLAARKDNSDLMTINPVVSTLACSGAHPGSIPLSSDGMKEFGGGLLHRR